MRDPVEYAVPESAADVQHEAEVQGSPLMVLGMHRSGTSLLTSLIAQAGIPIGENLLESARDNPRGYFEDTGFVDFHNACLEARGFSFTEPPVEALMWTDEETDRARSMLAERGWASFNEQSQEASRDAAPVFAFKDPRACLFASEWIRICPQMRVVAVHRHPIRVLASLMRRGEKIAALSAAAGAQLWLRYSRSLLDALELMPQSACVVLDAESIFDDPQQIIAGLGRVGVSLDQESVESISMRDEFRSLMGVESFMDWCEIVAPGTAAVREKLLTMSSTAQVDESSAATEIVDLIVRAADAWKADSSSEGTRLLSDTLARSAFMLFDPSIPEALAVYGSEAVVRRHLAAQRALTALADPATAASDSSDNPPAESVASGDDAVMIHEQPGGETNAEIEEQDAPANQSPSETESDIEQRNRMTQLDNLSIASRIDGIEVLESAAFHSAAAKGIDYGGAELKLALEQYIERDPHPLPMPDDREGYYGDRHLEYWLSGLRDYILMMDRLESHGIKFDTDEAVFELGAASGRVGRHFWCQGGYENLCCSDISSRHIEWIRRFLPSGIKIFQNTILPNVPLADNSVSLAFAFSVFTHIDAYELAWIAELNRFIRPGGIAYLTVHTERTWDRLNPNIGLYNWLVRSKKQNNLGIKMTEEVLAEPMPAERIAFGDGKVYGANVFHTTEYLEQTWGRYFDVLEIIDAGAEYQDVAILRKR